MTEMQEMLLVSLISVKLDQTSIITLMLMLQEDEEAMVDLIRWIYYEEPETDEVMNIWVMNYLKAHTEFQN